MSCCHLKKSTKFRKKDCMTCLRRRLWILSMNQPELLKHEDNVRLKKINEYSGYLTQDEYMTSKSWAYDCIRRCSDDSRRYEKTGQWMGDVAEDWYWKVHFGKVEHFFSVTNAEKNIQNITFICIIKNINLKQVIFVVSIHVCLKYNAHALSLYQQCLGLALMNIDRLL